MEERAQINLEYLLIVVGAIVVVSTVALFMKSAANSVSDAAISKANP